MLKRFKWLLLLSTCLTVTLPSVSMPIVQAFSSGALHYGSRGSDVRELEGRLKFLGYYHGKVDGIFGWRTYWSVRRFQYRFGMKIDGIAGPHTESTLIKATQNWHGAKQSNSATKAPASTPTTAVKHTNQFHSAPVISGLNKSDLNLLAHLVHGEARGEPLKGQVAVADVILHRLKSSKFPNSIPGVIYQPGAFTAATNGQMALPINKQSMTAVLDAVHGWDPAHGALYYFNPAKTNNKFVWSRPEIIKIGHHIFTK
ncbi:spore cortex-lytic enzyme [Alicyclobacillus sp. SO9]|uniref:spore cortex-lytic enzyme n=1 Tax=Alicyclobacillus sp. SO9 TaxID=2665646 RepID=UPI0018E6EEA9|nr:spore cortex-lytic enzyme [Alicyclobacillus sp. SO9]QQE76834.1 spore cortex-lytic enzyme [Alicyclobacillus sp. SO9]